MVKLLFVVTEDWYFSSHRLALAIHAKKSGYEVTLASRFHIHRSAIETAGCRTISFSMNRRGLNPFLLIQEALALAQIFRQEKPDLVHLVALRPVVIGNIACHLARSPRLVSAITGMGFLFTDRKRSKLIRRVLQTVLPRLLSKGITIVQNHDDEKQLQSFGLPAHVIRLIPGAGVDTSRFIPSSTNSCIVPIIMMASRLLWDKGVGEFVEAARQLNGSGARFVLVGSIDHDNPSSVSHSDLKGWISHGLIEWWGHSTNMATTLAQADLFCLPSYYREGLPLVLLEAMACGKACVVADVPGCRDAVRHGDNGLLVPAKDSTALAQAIKQLLDDTTLRQCMGTRGRERAVKEFGQRQIIESTLAVYREALT